MKKFKDYENAARNMDSIGLMIILIAVIIMIKVAQL